MVLPASELYCARMPSTTNAVRVCVCVGHRCLGGGGGQEERDEPHSGGSQGRPALQGAHEECRS